MLRGVITITKEEAQEALPYVQKYFAGMPFENKLNAALAANENPIKLQLGDYEVEELLDNIGAPSCEEPEVRAQLRRSLQAFLTHLKGL